MDVAFHTHGKPIVHIPDPKVSRLGNEKFDESNELVHCDVAEER